MYFNQFQERFHLRRKYDSIIFQWNRKEIIHIGVTRKMKKPLATAYNEEYRKHSKNKD